jgi:drug/metabolite transporter (DMT)-like permease
VALFAILESPLRLFLLTCLTMIAFAANSVLNRMALADATMEALDFGVIRVVSGAVTLALLVVVLRGGIRLGGARRANGVISLLVYIFGFSLAYRALDAGVGALILFGVVQMTMFAGALIKGERPSVNRWIGAGVAFAGLAWLTWPGEGAQVPLVAASFMALAGVGWGVYSLVGRGATDGFSETAANFILAAPVAVVIGVAAGFGAEMPLNGVLLAVLSGAVTSGLGYALWYAVLPQLEASVAAVAQLTVPVIAMAGGLLFLAEVPGWDFMIGAVLVLGGVGVSLVRKRNA